MGRGFNSRRLHHFSGFNKLHCALAV